LTRFHHVKEVYMQELASTTPVLILGYGTWSSPGDAEQIAFKSGKLAEWVQVREDDGTVRKFGMAESVNGDRVDPMQSALLAIRLAVKVNKGGHEMPKLTVYGMKPVPTGK